MFTYNHDQKKAVKQNKLDHILKNTFPLLYTTTSIIDNDTVQVTLPDLKFIPDGAEDLTSTHFTAPNNTQWRMNLWRVIKKDQLRIILDGVEYTSAIKEEASTVLTIKKGKIIKIGTGEFTSCDVLPTGKH